MCSASVNCELIVKYSIIDKNNYYIFIYLFILFTAPGTVTSDNHTDDMTPGQISCVTQATKVAD